VIVLSIIKKKTLIKFCQKKFAFSSFTSLSPHLFFFFFFKFPKGIDIIYESVGGNFFDICMKQLDICFPLLSSSLLITLIIRKNSLAIKGRLIVIGSISSYQGGTSNMMKDGFKGNISSYELLSGSKTITGFFLNHYTSLFPKHLSRLVSLYEKGSDLFATIFDKVMIVFLTLFSPTSGELKAAIDSTFRGVSFLFLCMLAVELSLSNIK